MTSIGQMNDIFKQLEECMKKCDSLSQDIKVIKKEHKQEIKKINNNFKKEKVQLNSQIASLNKIIVQKDGKIEKLENEVDRLKKQINNNSNNSSNPPSTDIKANKKIVNNRKETKNNVGGQKGHKGITLSKKYVEDNIKNKKFEHEIVHIGKISNKYNSKFKLDISVNVIATEYRFYADENGKINIPKEFQSNVQYGSEIKTLCSVLNTEGIVAINRLTDFVSSILHGKINISNGTIVNFVKELSKKISKPLKEIEKKILNSNLMRTDATPVRCDNKNISVRNYSTKEYTLLKATKRKSKKDIEETNILPKYCGNLIHDHETVIYNYGKGHGKCNVHLLRYLTANYENTNNKWCKDMKNFLVSLNNMKKRKIVKGINHITKQDFKKYSMRFDEIVESGIEENKKVKSKYYKQEEKKLLDRLKKYKSNHLLFIENFEIPFDNNLSERELRHVKSKQKISGHFKSIEGVQNYLDIKSIITTCKKIEKNFYTTIKNIFDNTPVTI